MEYSSLTDMQAFVVSQFPKADPDLVESLLISSAGTNCLEEDDPDYAVIYRPFFVTARLLQMRYDLPKAFRSAAGSSIEYRDELTAMRAMNATQGALDNAICNIPEGWEATTIGPGVMRMERVYG